MKARKEKTTCLLGVAGSVKASVHVLVKGKKGESPAPEPAIKGKRSCLLDREQRSVHGKTKVKGKSAMSNLTLTLLKTPWRGKKRFLVDGIGRGGQQHPM